MTASILIVDDNPVNLKLASEILTMEGYAVVSAVDAEEALQVLKGITPALVLMDIALPGMDGLTLTRQLKADPRLKSLPIVALSAFAMKGEAEKALQAGCDGYITKPIDTRKFPAQVAAYLRPASPP